MCYSQESGHSAVEASTDDGFSSAKHLAAFITDGSPPNVSNLVTTLGSMCIKQIYSRQNTSMALEPVFCHAKRNGTYSNTSGVFYSERFNSDEPKDYHLDCGLLFVAFKTSYYFLPISQGNGSLDFLVVATML